MKKYLMTALALCVLTLNCCYAGGMDNKAETIKYLSSASRKANNNDYTGAVKDLEQALKYMPKEQTDMEAYVYYTKGIIEAENLKNLDKGLKDLAQATKLDSRMTLNLLDQIANSMKKQDYKTAEKYLTVIINTQNMPSVNKAEAYKMRAQLRELLLNDKEGAGFDYGMYYQTIQAK